MNNRAYNLKSYIEGDKLLSPLELISISDEMGLSIHERYILQKQQLMNNHKNTAGELFSINTDKIAVDIINKINKALNT